jgi:alkylated DNA repair dioxygenase AlkB
MPANIRSDMLDRMERGLAWQGTFLGAGTPEPDPTFATLCRHPLGLAGDAWVDLAPGWLAGADELLAELLGTLDWQGQVVHMYERKLPQPRLHARLPEPQHRPPAVEQMRSLLSDRYGVELTSIGANLYRDGRDSVAWHGDRIARDQDTAIIAIVSLGGRRRFLLRPTGGGTSRRFILGSGDLLVMGGSCQRTWQHCVPKVASAEPRVSLTFRHAYVD